MAAWEYLDLRQKQAELFVLKQILAAFSADKKPDLYIEPGSLEPTLGSHVPTQNLISQHQALKRLEEKGLLQVIDPSTFLGIHLLILDLGSIKELYGILLTSIPATGNSARIIYSRKTGVGMANGIRFKLNRGSRNRKIFDYLAENPNRYLDKRTIWKKAGEKGTFVNDPDGVIEFNTIITTLRESLKNIGPEHLRLKGTVILDADITLTD